ncbi:MAG: class I SAM-dependent methyltransferase [Thermoplasmata archaeon]
MEETELTVSKIVELYHEYQNDLRAVRASLVQIYSSRKSLRDRFLVETGAALLPFLPDPVLRSLRRVDRVVRSSSPTLRPSFDDVEAEVTYLLIRNSRPQVVVEISPSGGWSSLWMLSALRDNGTGCLYSYDLVDDATRNIPATLSEQRWMFVRGDVRRAVRRLPRPIDYLFIDSDHSAEFADWYLQNVFPLLSPNAIVSVDDVFRGPDDWPREFGEGQRVLEWLKTHGLAYLSFSPYSFSTKYEQAMRAKSELKMDSPIHTSIVNPCLFFSYRSAHSEPRHHEGSPDITAIRQNA